MEESPILCPKCGGKRQRARTAKNEVAEYCPKCKKWQGDREAMDQSLVT